MSPVAELSTVEEACALVVRWGRSARDLAGSPIDLPFAVPKAVETVNRRLGRLWLEAPDTGSLGSQDRLVSPHGYRAEPDGTVAVAWENQGVWGCGYRPATGDQLWVTGDWPDDQCGTREWRPTTDVLDTAVIFILLANTIWASDDCVMDEEDERPAAAERLLWTFAPFSGFAGFWTDARMTLLRMQGHGWGVTARHRNDAERHRGER